jgi:hypothetical protein
MNKENFSEISLQKAAPSMTTNKNMRKDNILSFKELLKESTK